MVQLGHIPNGQQFHSKQPLLDIHQLAESLIS